MNLRSCVREDTYPEKYLRLDGLIQEEVGHVSCTLTVFLLLLGGGVIIGHYMQQEPQREQSPIFPAMA